MKPPKMLTGNRKLDIRLENKRLLDANNTGFSCVCTNINTGDRLRIFSFFSRQ